MRMVSAWLVALSGFAITVGGHDAFLADPFSARLFGALLLVAAVVLLVPVAGLFFRCPWAYPTGILAGLVAVLLGGYLLAASVANRDDRNLPLWSIVTALSALCVVLVRREGRVTLRQLLRPGHGVLVPLLSVTTLVGVSQFWQATVYAPAAATPTLVVTIDLTKERETTRVATLHAAITIANAGDSRVRVVDARYVATGFRLASADGTSDAFANRLVRGERLAQEGSTGPAGVPRAYRETGTRIVQTGRLLPSSWWFDTGEQWRSSFEIDVPPHRFDVLRLIATVVVGKDSLRLSAAPTTPPRLERLGGERLLVTERAIEESSWVHTLVRAPRLLLSYLVVGAGTPRGVGTAGAYVDRAGRRQAVPGRDPYNDEMALFYGLAGTYSTAEIVP
jgi:hypothetical protein